MVLIAVKSDIVSQELILNSNTQLLAISIQGPYTIKIGSIYIPPGQPLPTDDIQTFLKFNNDSTLLVGDFNAHNFLWGSSKTNYSGRQLEQLLDVSDLSLFNPFGKTHYNYSHHT